ncbi:MAG: hypothetical protein ACQET7_09800 [Thermodesulfobacteriota bacterium]
MDGKSFGPKERLIRILQGVLETDIDLSFLTALKKSEIETLVACIRNRVDNPLK